MNLRINRSRGYKSMGKESMPSKLTIRDNVGRLRLILKVDNPIDLAADPVLASSVSIFFKVSTCPCQQDFLVVRSPSALCGHTICPQPRVYLSILFIMKKCIN